MNSGLLQIDAMDYDRRLQAYGCLRAKAWAQMGPVQALPLLHQSLADMRRTDDLAIRSAAAQALGRLIIAGGIEGPPAAGETTIAKQQAQRADWLYAQMCA